MNRKRRRLRRLLEGALHLSGLPHGLFLLSVIICAAILLRLVTLTTWSFPIILLAGLLVLGVAAALVYLLIRHSRHMRDFMLNAIAPEDDSEEE